jgi:hypothetical protein
MNLNKTGRPDDKQLLAGLDEYTAHADALAKPSLHQLDPSRAPHGKTLHDTQPEEQSGERGDRAGYNSPYA